MIVVDTSVVVQLLVDSVDTALVRELALADGDWKAPSLWRAEFLNVLATQWKAGGMSSELMLDLGDQASAFKGLSEHEPSAESVLRTVIEYRISAYDAQFLALARTFHVPLLSLDKKLIRASQGLAYHPQDFLGLS